MLPPFDIEGGVALAAARAFAVAGLVTGFGGVLYPVLLAPRGLDRRTAALLRLLGYGGLVFGLIGLLVWLVAETSDMAGDMDPGSIRTVLTDTTYGHLLLPQFGLLALAILAWRFVPVAAAVLAGLAVMLQAGHSHAEAMDGISVLLGADVLHVLAAAMWLGCLVPLLVVVGREPPDVAARAAKGFSALVSVCVTVMLMTAAYQAVVLLGGLTGIIGTAYGWMAMLKTALFVVLLVLAVRDRARLVPALRGLSPGAARRLLVRSIAMQVAFAVAVIAAAGVLTELPPGMHTQPIWPFAWRLSFDAVHEDPDFMREAVRGGVMMAAAVLLLLGVGVSLIRWRRSWRAWGVRGGVTGAALVVALLAAPHLDLLFVPAYPTQYFHSPTGFSVASVAEGAALFPANCAACHGADGRGDGPGAHGLPVPPANLTAAHLWMHPDGELFWWLAHGIEGPDGGLAMPGFADTLSDDQRWDLIDYIRGHNAGSSVGADGRWGRVVRAPGFEALCAGGQTRQLDDFVGQPVRLVLGKAAAVAGVVTIAADERSQPGPGVCVARDKQLAAAYGVVSGLGGQDLGAVFLIDADGLLRRVWRPDAAPDAGALMAAMMDARAHRVAPALAAGMKMDGMDMGGMKMGGMKM
jgi:putative copper export protein/mono/diheme cytochrome c family protein